MILLIPRCGLCNRMRAISGMYYVARKLEKKLVVFWVVNEECGAPTRELFSLPENIIVFNINSEQNIFWRIIYFLFTHLFCYVPNTVVKQIKNKKITREIRKIFNKAIVVCETESDIISRMDCSIFRPTKEITHACNKVIENQGKYVAVHIRRTDNSKAKKYSKLELFEEKIDELILEGKKIYLATDDIIVKNRLKRKYEPFMFEQNIKCVRRDSVQGIKEAYIELLCMAHAETIYGSYYSSFSEMAAKLGQGRLVVIQ